MSCTTEVYDEQPILEIPESLFIQDPSGLKLENYVVQDKVRINTKLSSDGEYRIKIIDFTNTVVSQEIIQGKKGDNILNIYVNSLPVSSYTVELYTKNNIFVGRQNFSMK
jgi:hypothetical protein